MGVNEAMTMDGLSGKLAVVTGASRGIGRFIAAALHGAGATVVITGRKESTLKKSAEEIGERCHWFVCDNSDPEAIKKMAKEVLGKFGTPDILVNNAGLIRHAPVVELSLDH
ncbi:MAG: SDR family NAD(P)-dependent oxidoreductase, partial [bacterium]